MKLKKIFKSQLFTIAVTALTTYIVVHISHIHDKWDGKLTYNEFEGIFLALAGLGILPVATIAKFRKNISDMSEEKKKFLEEYEKLKKDVKKLKGE